MRRRPPRSTRTDTLFPYTTLFRSLTDLVGGQTSYMFAILPESMPLVKSGQLRALAVTTSKRLPDYLDLHTVAESGVPGYELIGRSEEHKSELQSIMSISYAVFCCTKKQHL